MNRPELRLPIAKVLAWQTLGQSDEMQWADEEKVWQVWQWVIDNKFETEYLEKADQILLLCPNEDEIRKDAIQKEREWMASNQYRDEQLEQVRKDAKRKERQRIRVMVMRKLRYSGKPDPYNDTLREIEQALRKGE